MKTFVQLVLFFMFGIMTLIGFWEPVAFIGIVALMLWSVTED